MSGRNFMRHMSKADLCPRPIKIFAAKASPVNFKYDATGNCVGLTMRYLNHHWNYALRPLLVLLICFLMGCHSTDQNDHARVLRIAFPSCPTSLHPQESSDFVSAQLLALLYEGLTRGRADGSSEPALAQSVEISPDGLHYQFFLRPSTWSDGSPVTAHDFASSWKRALNPEAPATCSYLLYPIQYAEEAVHGLVPVNDVAIRALDDLTLEVDLCHPTPHFLEIVSLASFFPTKGSLYNGPFVIDSVEPHHELRLTKNPHFWNRDVIALDQIRIAIVPDSMTALRLFEQGELDWIGGALSPLPLDTLPTLRETAHDALHFLPSSASTFCTFNTGRFPFQNLHLRNAFAYALNLEEIVTHIGQGIVPTRCVPPILFTTPPATLFTAHQPEQAQHHLHIALQELGITKEGLGTITLQHRSGMLEKQVATLLAEQWKHILGIEVALEQVDTQTQRDSLYRRDYQLSLAVWIAQYHDPINILERFAKPRNPKNYPGWEHPRFAALLKQADLLSEHSQERQACLDAAETLLLEEMPLVPIYHWNYPYLSSPRVAHLTASPCGAVLFERARIVEP